MANAGAGEDQNDVKATTLVEFANRAIEAGGVISSDAYYSYKVLAKEGFQHKGPKSLIRKRIQITCSGFTRDI